MADKHSSNHDVGANDIMNTYSRTLIFEKKGAIDIDGKSKCNTLNEVLKEIFESMTDTEHVMIRLIASRAKKLSETEVSEK